MSLIQIELVLVLFLCILYSLCSFYLTEYKRKYKKSLWLHETSIITLLSLILSYILKYYLYKVILFNNLIFFYLVLPPIIFSAGYNLKRRNFFKYIHLISLFGILGTLLQFILITIISYYIFNYFIIYIHYNSYHNNNNRYLESSSPLLLSSSLLESSLSSNSFLNNQNYNENSFIYLTQSQPLLQSNSESDELIFTWQDALLFACILSGSDEVSAMSLVKMKDFPRMGALIFGEGVLNDALSIVLFKVLIDWIGNSPSSPTLSSSNSSSTLTSNSSLSKINIHFILSLASTLVIEIFLSCFIGVVCGLVHARLLMLLPSLRSHPIHQTSLILLFGYSSYCIAELTGHASGILTLFVAAIILAHYSFHSLSKTTQLTTQIAFTSFSELAEALSFSYLGLSFFSLSYTHTRLLFSFIMLISLILVRFGTIFSLFYLTGSKIPINEQIGFSLGGMVRGSICWAQVQLIRSSSNPIITTSIVFIVMCTTIGGGIIMPILMPRLTNSLLNEQKSNENNSQLILNQFETMHEAFNPNNTSMMETDEDQESTYTTHLSNGLDETISTGKFI